MQKWMLFFLIFGLWTTPVMAEEPQAAVKIVAEPIKEVRDGPVTATDKLVDRFMALNMDPEESAGVEFGEYWVMVSERAEQRFAEMDANDDDEVTADEYRKFWTTRKAQWYRLKH